MVPIANAVLLLSVKGREGHRSREGPLSDRGLNTTNEIVHANAIMVPNNDVKRGVDATYVLEVDSEGLPRRRQVLLDHLGAVDGERLAIADCLDLEEGI